MDIIAIYTDVYSVLTRYHAGAVFASGRYEEPIKKPIIQYRETDWQFINRLASRCQSFIMPDISQPKPWIYFGMKQNGQDVIFDETEYCQPDVTLEAMLQMNIKQEAD